MQTGIKGGLIWMYRHHVLFHYRQHICLYEARVYIAFYPAGVFDGGVAPTPRFALESHIHTSRCPESVETREVDQLFLLEDNSYNVIGYNAATAIANRCHTRINHC